MSQAVFTLARKLSPCVIFIDEIDAIFGRRSGHESNVDRKVKNILMQVRRCVGGMRAVWVWMDGGWVIRGRLRVGPDPDPPPPFPPPPEPQIYATGEEQFFSVGPGVARWLECPSLCSLAVNGFLTPICA